jgi:hypothetical protein
MSARLGNRDAIPRATEQSANLAGRLSAKLDERGRLTTVRTRFVNHLSLTLTHITTQGPRTHKPPTSGKCCPYPKVYKYTIRSNSLAPTLKYISGEYPRAKSPGRSRSNSTYISLSLPEGIASFRTIGDRGQYLPLFGDTAKAHKTCRLSTILRKLTKLAAFRRSCESLQYLPTPKGI